MSDGLNSVHLMGNLAADPELRFTQAGQAVLNMRLAINDSYVDKNKVRQERTEWVNVVVWGPRGEALSKFLKKGGALFVDGSMRTSSYEKDGRKVYKTEVVANNVILAGGKGGERTESSGSAARGSKPKQPSDTGTNYGDDDKMPIEDVPF
jgi:single-strand DNA-binding protein